MGARSRGRDAPAGLDPILEQVLIGRTEPTQAGYLLGISEWELSSQLRSLIWARADEEEGDQEGTMAGRPSRHPSPGARP